MRQQYHFRESAAGLCAWDVTKLVALAKSLRIQNIPLTQIAEIEEDYWFAPIGAAPTCRAIVEHVTLIDQADLRYPILLCADGRLMDGMHRVAKALLLKHNTIRAVRFPATPQPDHIGKSPEELPY